MRECRVFIRAKNPHNINRFINLFTHQPIIDTTSTMETSLRDYFKAQGHNTGALYGIKKSFSGVKNRLIKQKGIYYTCAIDDLWTDSIYPLFAIRNVVSYLMHGGVGSSIIEGVSKRYVDNYGVLALLARTFNIDIEVMALIPYDNLGLHVTSDYRGVLEQEEFNCDEFRSCGCEDDDCECDEYDIEADYRVVDLPMRFK